MATSGKRRGPGTRMRLGPMGLGTLLAIAVAGPAPAAAAEKGDSERLQRIQAAYDAKDCKTAAELGAPILDRRGGTGFAPDLEANLYDIVVGCEAELDLAEAYYAHALRATALEESSDYLWRARFAGELQTNRYAAAVATVEAMAQGRGRALNAIPVGWMWILDRELKKGDRALRRRLFAVLSQDSYAPAELYGPPDAFRADYATILAEAGEREAARAMVARIENPITLSEAMLDPALRDLVPPSVDLRALSETSLLGSREAIARHPDRLGALNEAAQTLRALGRPQQALELLQSVSARIDDPAAFEDRDEQINWYWDSVARSEAALGRYDKAVAAFRKGAGSGEGGAPNVSQIINLAVLQATARHGEEALQSLAPFDDQARDASPYGMMEMRMARGCAHAVAGHTAQAKAELDYMRAHESDHPEAVSDLMLCMNDLDGAAASFIRRLGDPEQRLRALTQLSDYDPPPVPDPNDPIDSRLPKVKARPDVQAAIARAGGIRRFPLQRGEL
jgi:tetratricopeptide (TPR) repeat protein